MDWLFRLRGEDPAGARGRAAALVNEATALSEAGRHAEAAAAEKQAIRLLRATRRAPRAEIAPLLARALLHQSNSLAALGDLAAAADLPEQAAAWIRGTPAQVLAAVGEDAEASAVSDQARTALRRRVGAAAAASGLDVEQARALTNHANRLLRVGSWQEAVDTVTEAVAVRRALAARNRLAHLPGLAMTLTNQAIMLSKISRWRDAYLGKLAEAVSNHAFLTETGAEKLRLYEEAVRLRRELSAQNRAVYLPWLARALDLLATQLAAAGPLGPALDAGHEAVELARESFAANRSGFLPHHAFLLREQTRRLDQAGQPAAAIALGAEAVAICREAVGRALSGRRPIPRPRSARVPRPVR